MISSISGASGAPLLQPIRSVQSSNAIAAPPASGRTLPASTGASRHGDGAPPSPNTPRGSLLNLTV